MSNQSYIRSSAQGLYPVEQASYVAIYPNGRECSVTADDAVRYAAKWAEDGVVVVTRMTEVLVPIVGRLVHVLP